MSFSNPNNISKAYGGSSNSMFPSSNSGKPFNNFGFQWPNTGEAYMGAISYSASTPLYRECIGQQLFSALSIGVKYYVTLFSF